MDILNKKWTIYDTSACPRCDERMETNDHLWRCEKAIPTVNNITSNFHQKYRIPDRLRNCTMLALRGIATTDLTFKIAAHLRTTQDDPIPVNEIREKSQRHTWASLQRAEKRYGFLGMKPPFYTKNTSSTFLPRINMNLPDHLSFLRRPSLPHGH